MELIQSNKDNTIKAYKTSNASCVSPYMIVCSEGKEELNKHYSWYEELEDMFFVFDKLSSI